MDDVTIRAPTPADVPRIAAVVAEGFDGYRSFAPAGWSPPPAEEHERYLRERLWYLALMILHPLTSSTIAGIVSMTPAANSRRAVDDPRLAHLWQLFIAREWWGSGLAKRLHGLVTEAARARSFTAMRLFTPADQARARRFYEREGWRLTGADPDDDIGFTVVEYRLDLG